MEIPRDLRKSLGIVQQITSFKQKLRCFTF